MLQTATAKRVVIGIEINSWQAVRIPDSDIDRLLEAAYLALPLMPEVVRGQVASLLTRQAMAVIAGVAVVWAGSQFFGVGEVVDVIFAGAAYIAVGWDAITAMHGFIRYYQLAVNAKNDDDIKAAAQEFANAMIAAINAIGWGRLGKWLGKGARSVRVVEDTAAQLARWRRFIEAIDFKIPRDKGMLWSKLGSSLESGSTEAERIAVHHKLTCLELELKKTGFFELYKKDFGDGFQRQIWEWVSQKYVQSLEGKVTAYVHRAKYFSDMRKNAVKAVGEDPERVHEFLKQINRGDPAKNIRPDPVLVTETKEISKILLSNPKITELTMIDIKTGEVFGYRSRELLESLQRLENGAH